MPTKVFYVVPVEPRTERVSLRRYHSSAASDPKCSASGTGYHNAETPLGDLLAIPAEPPHDDPRWPTHCACGYQFQDDDEWQVFHRQLYRRFDGQSGGPWTLQDGDLPPGGMWNASWYPADSDFWHGADGLALVVRLPNRYDWHIDGPCNNCTRVGEPHKCWVRHGDPRLGQEVHVDKNGNTCSAGAGSIVAGNYHGFLHHGYLTDGM